MYRHVAKDDPNKVDQNKLEGGAAKAKAEVEKKRLPPDWVSQSSLKHPLLPSVKKVRAIAARAGCAVHATWQRAPAARLSIFSPFLRLPPFPPPRPCPLIVTWLALLTARF